MSSFYGTMTESCESYERKRRGSYEDVSKRKGSMRSGKAPFTGISDGGSLDILTERVNRMPQPGRRKDHFTEHWGGAVGESLQGEGAVE